MKKAYLFISEIIIANVKNTLEKKTNTLFPALLTNVYLRPNVFRNEQNILHTIFNV